MISILAPAKGATKIGSRSFSPPEFQSTLPRRERLTNSEIVVKSDSISIHAPAKGATKGDISDITLMLISIHAPAKGATFRNVIY